jgi:DNA modification methylase
MSTCRPGFMPWPFFVSDFVYFGGMEKTGKIVPGDQVKIPVYSGRTVFLSELRVNPDNPRVIKDKDFKELMGSLRQFPRMMALRPLVVDGLDGVVWGGNQRFKALRELGYDEVPQEWVKVMDPDMTEAEKREFLVRDNVSSGEWDWEQLKVWDGELLQEWGVEVPPFIEAGRNYEDGKFDVGVGIATDVKLGDVYQVGDHRLMCGSSTDEGDVRELMGGAVPFLMVTDPPYGVDYDPEWRRKFGYNKSARMGLVENDGEVDWREAWALSPASVAYVWHAGKYASKVQESLESQAFEVRSQIIWTKNQMVFSRGNYHWKHEPCWYCVKKGAKANWIGDRKQNTVWDIEGLNWAQKRDGSKDVVTTHGTQKPVECMARPIRHHGGDVYDPFGGSGTTMVAAEQLGRKCFMMELNPQFVQLILDRMAKSFPGIEIRRVAGAIRRDAPEVFIQMTPEEERAAERTHPVIKQEVEEDF